MPLNIVFLRPQKCPVGRKRQIDVAGQKLPRDTCRNENRNEGTFAKTTLHETALLSPNDPFWGFAKGWFPKGWFGGCSPGTKTGTRVRSPKPPFYETALLSPSENWRCTAVLSLGSVGLGFLKLV